MSTTLPNGNRLTSLSPPSGQEYIESGDLALKYAKMRGFPPEIILAFVETGAKLVVDFWILFFIYYIFVKFL